MAKHDPTRVDDDLLHVLTLGRNMRGNIKHTLRSTFADPEAAVKARDEFVIVQNKTAVIFYNDRVWQLVNGRYVKKGGQ